MTQAILGKWHLSSITFVFCDWQMRIIRKHLLGKKTLIYMAKHTVYANLMDGLIRIGECDWFKLFFFF